MKRDFDLIRALLLELESLDASKFVAWARLQFNDPNAEAIAYHLGLMRQAGYLDPGRYEWAAWEITGAGRELLDKIRDPKVWNWMKATCESSEVPLFSGSIDALHEKLQRSGGVLA